VDEQPIYQPMAFGIDTLLKQEILYDVDETKYTVAFNDEGLVSMSVENPMINAAHAEKAVYAFAQVDTLNGSAERTIQLVMINALDESCVDIVQDNSLANIKGDDFSNAYFDNLNRDDTSQ